MKKIVLLLTSALFLSGSLSAFDIDARVGVHDFVVTDIKNDSPNDGIEAGTSHTLGLNIGIIARHTTPSNIHFLAKAEAFLDRDRDHLDPDHIPVWFAFLLDVDGEVYKLDQNNRFKWYVLMDNKQNTSAVSNVRYGSMWVSDMSLVPADLDLMPMPTRAFTI